MAQVLSLENVTLAVEKENSKQAIVKHVSFFINEGEIVALVGGRCSFPPLPSPSLLLFPPQSLQFHYFPLSF